MLLRQFAQYILGLVFLVTSSFASSNTEFTFINHSIYRENGKVSRLPRIGLDSPSTPGRPDPETIFV